MDEINGELANGRVKFHRKQKLKAVSVALKSVTTNAALNKTDKNAEEDDLDLNLFRQLAITEGGLVRDEFRRKIWPMLINMNYLSEEDDFESAKSTLNGEESDNSNPLNYSCEDFSPERVEQLKKHAEYSQVMMDVHRTLARFPPNVTDEQRLDLQDKLTPIIVAILAENAQYKYYQGFHDVCLTVLLVCDDAQAAYYLCSKLARSYFRLFLSHTLDEACKTLEYMYPIIYSVDPELYSFMRRSQVGVHFALSWLITWFAHVIDDYKSIVRMYDLFVASHPLMPVYLTASVVLYRSNEILSQECDMPYIHGLLSKMPKSLPLEALICDAQDLFLQFPPSKLPELTRRMLLVSHRKSRPFIENLNPRQAGMKFFVWGVATAAAAYYVYNHYNQMFIRI